MPEEVNSKALAAGSTANRLEFHRKTGWKTAGSGDAAFVHVVGLWGPLIEVSGYDLPNGVPRSAPGNSDKRPENEFTPGVHTYG